MSEPVEHGEWSHSPCLVCNLCPEYDGDPPQPGWFTLLLPESRCTHEGTHELWMKPPPLREERIA